jgi:hypothetical protein
MRKTSARTFFFRPLAFPTAAGEDDAQMSDSTWQEDAASGVEEEAAETKEDQKSVPSPIVLEACHTLGGGESLSSTPKARRG